MSAILKRIAMLFLLALAGGMTLCAQHHPGERLPRVLDPLGILPAPRQVIRTLDHAAHVLPPVVIETRGYPAFGYDDCARPVRIAPRHRHCWDRHHRRWAHRGCDLDYHRHRGWR